MRTLERPSRKLGGVALPLLVGLAIVLVAACGPEPRTGKPSAGPDSGAAALGEPGGAPARPRGTLKIAYLREPDNLNPKLTTGSGIGEFMWVFNSFLTYYDFSGASHPMLAREIPTQTNGDWVVHADGTMVTTYRLRANARWHDGQPVTAHDFVFTYQVYMDRDIPVIHREPEPLMSNVQALNDHTLTISWKSLYPRANILGYRELNPLPRHLLEERYRSSKATFVHGEEWTTAYVSTGPFRVDQWHRGSSLLARAHLDWVLGPPKLEGLEIRFIGDQATILANLLAGEVDVVTSPAARAAEAAVAREQWVARGQGYLKTWETRLSFLDIQFREVPNWQRALADLRVRQGLIQAIDRPRLAEAVTYGLGPAADAFIAPPDPLFPEVDRAITKYPFDPGRAQARLAEAGWRPGPGGSLIHASGQNLDVDVMGAADNSDSVTIIADNWRAVGVNPSLTIIPAARAGDRAYRASFPGVQVNGRSISLENFHFVSAQLPLPETGFVELNRGSFQDADVDRLHHLALTSLDKRARDEATMALLKHMSELAAYIPLHYSVEVILAKNRVRGPVGNYGPQIGITWNVFEWELAD